jgi:glycogen debranching enzyme
MKQIIYLLIIGSLVLACNSGKKEKNNSLSDPLKEEIQKDTTLQIVKSKALEIIKKGFNAGDGYAEVWIRDYTTFIDLATEVYNKDLLKKNLRVFFRLQGDDGNIIDGFIPKEKAKPTKGGYTFIFTDLEKQYAGHKNTVETDQETSLVQAVYKYVRKNNDHDFLKEKIGSKTIAERLEWSMDFLMNKRYNKKYGLIWGATTADWGDVQPEHDWGVFLTDDSHLAIDIYDNAMFLIALNNMMELLPDTKTKWKPVHDNIANNTMKYLWDPKNEKFIPHIYLNGSPFPKDLDENQIYYHGGTAVAIQAGLLNKEQIKVSLEKMIDNVKRSGAGSIGLTLYPPYPEGTFKNKGMYPYAYQNGGDWTWFGARMIIALAENGFMNEAYEQAKPMFDRVVKNNGFYEWYTVDNKPKGSATFKGSAGVLYDVILIFEKYAQ